MKQRKPANLFLPLLWFIAAGLWGATFFRALSNGNGSWVHAAVAALCLILGIVNFRRFLRDRKN
jgi:uncharacterized membrane protein